MTAATRVLAVMLGGIWLSSAAVGLQGAAGSPGSQAGSADVVKSLAGVWRAPEYKMKRTSEVGERVFGSNAFDLRTVELTLQPSGEGLLRISTEVLDAKGRRWAPMITEAKLLVGAPSQSAPSATGKIEPAVKVTGAEEQYLDETKYRSPVSGVRVRLLTDAATREVELRFETPNGAGSFWTTLLRPARPAAKAGGN
jgi:hypothetical protein